MAIPLFTRAGVNQNKRGLKVYRFTARRCFIEAAFSLFSVERI
jgi:hypothetical protein